MGYAEALAFVLKRWHWFAIAGLALTVWIQRGQVNRAKAARDDARAEVMAALRGARAEVILIKQGHERALDEYRKQVVEAQLEADSRAVAASDWQARYIAASRRGRTPAPPECAGAVKWLGEQGRAVAW